jgi:hypothetical protein
MEFAFRVGGLRRPVKHRAAQRDPPSLLPAGAIRERSAARALEKLTWRGGVSGGGPSLNEPHGLLTPAHREQDPTQ